MPERECLSKALCVALVVLLSVLLPAHSSAAGSEDVEDMIDAYGLEDPVTDNTPKARLPAHFLF